MDEEKVYYDAGGVLITSERVLFPRLLFGTRQYAPAEITSMSTYTIPARQGAGTAFMPKDLLRYYSLQALGAIFIGASCSTVSNALYEQDWFRVGLAALGILLTVTVWWLARRIRQTKGMKPRDAYAIRLQVRGKVVAVYASHELSYLDKIFRALEQAVADAQ